MYTYPFPPTGFCLILASRLFSTCIINLRLNFFLPSKTIFISLQWTVHWYLVKWEPSRVPELVLFQEIITYVCVYESLNHVQHFATPWTVQLLLSVEFCRKEYCNGLQFPSPGDLPGPGIEPKSPALQTDSLKPCVRAQIVKNLFSEMAAI